MDGDGCALRGDRKVMPLQEKYNVLLSVAQQISDEQHPELTRMYVDTFKKYVPAGKNLKVLDLGVGEGPQEVQQLRDAGYDVYAINIQQWRANDPKSVVGDMNDQSFAEETFDGAYSTQIFEHNYIPWLGLMETWISLKKGGKLYFNVPRCDIHQDVTHPTMLSLDQWKRIIQQTGYKIILAHEFNIVKDEPIHEFVVEKNTPESACMKQMLKKLGELRRRV
jgi:SAM-dependent methyltransferase